MPHHTRSLICVMLLVLAAAAPARAANPKVTLRVEEATAEQAAALLGKAADTGIQVYTPGNPRGVLGQQPDAGPRASFDWKDVPFSKALRELCAKFGFRPSRRPGGYFLYPGGAAPAPGQKRVGLVEKSGVRLFLRSISLYENRTVNFVDNQPDFNHANLNIQLMAELGDGDAELIAGVENVIGRDDLGNVLSSQGRSYYSGGDGSYPDEWTGGVSLPAVHPRAKKLQWLDGDLMGYRSVKPLRVEIPLPYTGPNARTQAGDVLFVVSRYQAGEAAREDEDEGVPPIRFAAAPQNGPSIRVRVFSPNGARLTARSGGWAMQPYITGASGRVYSGSINSSRSVGDGQMSVQDFTIHFPGMEEPPAKLVWDLVEKSDPVKLFSFRMTDIALPQPPAFVPRAAVPAPAPGAADPDEGRPFYQKGGGALVSAVHLASGPADGGEVQVGMALKNGAVFGPIRWTGVLVAPDGTLRLENVKPGVYRLVRKYRPQDGAAPAAGGRWLAADLQVTIAAGKESAVPPLRWTAGPVPRPASPPKAPAPPKKLPGKK